MKAYDSYRGQRIDDHPHHGSPEVLLGRFRRLAVSAQEAVLLLLPLLAKLGVSRIPRRADGQDVHLHGELFLVLRRGGGRQGG